MQSPTPSSALKGLKLIPGKYGIEARQAGGVLSLHLGKGTDTFLQ